MVFSQQQVIAMQVHVPANARQFQHDASPAQNNAATILNECSIFPGKNNLNSAQMHQIQPSAKHQITSTTTTTKTTTTTTIKQTPSMLQYKGPFATYLLCIEKLTNQLFTSSGSNNSEISCTSFCKKAQDLFISVANMKQGKHRNKKKTLLALCAASVYHYCKIHRSVSRTIKELLKLMNSCNGEQQKKNGAKSAKKQLAQQKENNDDAEEEDGVHVQRKQFTHALKLIQQNLFGNGSAVLSKLEENKQAPLKTAAVSAASQVLTRSELEMITRVASPQQQEIVSTSSPEISSSEEDNHDEQMKHEYSPSVENGDDDEENEGTLIMKDDFKEEQVVVVPPVMVRSPPKQQKEQQEAIPVATQCVDLLALANMAAAESIKIEQSTSSGEAITAQKIDFAKRTLANVFHDQAAASDSLYQFCLDKCIELFNKFPSRVARTITAVAIFITVQREQAKLHNKFKTAIHKQGPVEESAQATPIKGIPSLMLMTTAEMLEFATRTTDVNCLSVRSVLKELKVL